MLISSLSQSLDMRPHVRSQICAWCFALVVASTSANLGFQTAFAQVATNTTPIQPGSKAPDFALPADNGKTVKLSGFAGKTVVVFFYDADSSPVTEDESRRIKKNYKKFQLAGADVLGIGADPVASHKAMKTKLDLQYYLLTDKDDEVRKLYGLPPAVSGPKGRYGVIVDKTGTVRKVVGGDEGLSEKNVTDMVDYLESMPGAGI
jgi:peroxiredoxin Q/BCP